MEQDLFKITIHVYGVKKRCRKVERHYFSAGYIPYNDGNFNQEEVEQLAQGVIESNMKQVRSAIQVSLDHIKRSDTEGGFTIESWGMFGKTNASFILQTSLEKELQWTKLF